MTRDAPYKLEIHVYKPVGATRRVARDAAGSTTWQVRPTRMSRPEEHSRGTTRLEGYDYALPGAYLCTQNRECLYGVVEEDEVLLNDFGKIVDEEWRKTPLIRPDVELDTFVVMPNHLHGIIMIHERATAAGIDTQVVGATRRVAPTQYAGPDTDRPQTDPGRPKGAPSGSRCHSRAVQVCIS